MHWIPPGSAAALPRLITLALALGAAAPGAAAPGAAAPATAQGDERALAGDGAASTPVARSPEVLAAFARAHSPRARALKLERRAAARAAQGAGSFMDPMLEARAAPLSVPGLLPEDPHEQLGVGVELMLSQRFPLSGRLGHERDRERALGARARHEVDAMLLDLELEAALLACEGWERAAELEVLQRSRELLGAMADVTRAQIAAGRASVGDAQRLDAEVAMVGLELAETDAARRAVDARTNALLGRAALAPLPAPPAEVPWLLADPPSLPTDERAELRARQATLDAAQAERARASDAWLPDLNATASWSTMWPISHQFLLGVGAELPLFNEGRQAEQESAGLRIEGARASLEDARARAEAAQAEARARDEGAARALAVLQERVVPLAAARADTARAALGAGASIDPALDATGAELNARTRLVRAQAERCRMRAELWRAAGVSFVPGSPSQEQP